MSKISFSKELVDAIVRYLAGRPYAEVNGIIEQMAKEAAEERKSQAAAATTPTETA